MARTAAHRLNNDLALVVGYTDLLARHPAVHSDPHVAAFARAAREGSLRAAEDLARLQRIVRLVEDASVALPFPVLDLVRSTAADLPSGPTEPAAPGPPAGAPAGPAADRS